MCQARRWTIRWHLTKCCWFAWLAALHTIAVQRLLWAWRQQTESMSWYLPLELMQKICEGFRFRMIQLRSNTDTKHQLSRIMAISIACCRSPFVRFLRGLWAAWSYMSSASYVRMPRTLEFPPNFWWFFDVHFDQRIPPCLDIKLGNTSESQIQCGIVTSQEESKYQIGDCSGLRPWPKHCWVNAAALPGHHLQCCVHRQCQCPQYISILIEPHISNLNVPVLVSAIIDPVDSDILTRAPLSPALPVFFLAR